LGTRRWRSEGEAGSEDTAFESTFRFDAGTGFLLGDGRLNYGRENIVESYYTLHVWRGIYPSLGLQHINNPGYNRDRGPVLVPTLRLHVEL